MMRAFRLPSRIVILVTVMLTGACSVLPAPSSYQLYQLPASNLSQQNEDRSLGSLQLNAPRADELTGSNRVVVLREGQQLSAWSGIRWAAPAPALWRDQMLDAFRNSGAFEALSIREDNLGADRSLTGHLRAFHVDQTGETPRAVIRLDAQLVDLPARELIAARRFEASETMPENNPSALARAMGTATDRMAEALLSWMAEQR